MARYEGAMSLDEFKAIVSAAAGLATDIESFTPTPDSEDWDAEAAQKYALVKYLLDCLNDSCCGGRIEYYEKEEGLKLPEADI